MTVASLSVPCTIIGERIFGKICLKIIVTSFAPSERTASIYSSRVNYNVVPRKNIEKN
jgi:hypothetical protein